MICVRVGLLLATCIACVVAIPRSQDSTRIIGGSVASISQYPAIAAILHSSDHSTYRQICGGTILNIRSILTAATCANGFPENSLRVRVGSSYANSGGAVHSVANVIIHPDFDNWTYDSDIAILYTATYITYVNNAVQAALIAGTNYIPNDDEEVWTAGWGYTDVEGPSSEQLRDVQVWIINQRTCRSRYTTLGWPVTDNMICSGWLDVGGHDQCQGDTGGPLYHNSVVVGLSSWAYQCAHSYYPTVNTRVSSFTNWIVENA